MGTGDLYITGSIAEAKSSQGGGSMVTIVRLCLMHGSDLAQAKDRSQSLVTFPLNLMASVKDG